MSEVRQQVLSELTVVEVVLVVVLERRGRYVSKSYHILSSDQQYLAYLVGNRVGKRVGNLSHGRLEQRDEDESI